MGADQSKPKQSGVSTKEAESEPDFYTLLQIDEGAGESEIKKAFRKQALIWHPDKNAHRVQESTAHFARLQEAYEILSDPVERSFYDRHRNDRLAAVEVTTEDFEDVLKGRKEPPRPTKKSRGMGVPELMRFFEKRVYDKVGMTDTPGGFFQVYETLFKHLAAEESAHAEKYMDYPSFGSSQTPWSLPKRTDIQARNFYTIWSTFVTEKNFEWIEMWETERADGRQVRRLMEKENKKARDDARREYNETVRALVAFIKKRDPRAPKPNTVPLFQPTLPRLSNSNLKSNSQSRSNLQPDGPVYTPQDWQRVQPGSGTVLSDFESSDEEDHDEGDDEGGEEDEDEPDGVGRVDAGESGEWECVVCGKTGKSEGRWRDHERSKLHRKEVEKLKREMVEEDWDLGLDGEDLDDEDLECEQDDEEEEGLKEQVDELNLAEEEGSIPSSTNTLPNSTQPFDSRHSQTQEEQHRDDDTDDDDISPIIQGSSKKARKKKQREEREARKRAELALASSTASSSKGARPNVAPIKNPGQEIDTVGVTSGLEEEKKGDEDKDKDEKEEEEEETGGKTEMSKKDKRRERERKKKEALQGGNTSSKESGEQTIVNGSEKCTICKSTFPSRTKLFAHISKTGHAALKNTGSAGGGGNRRLLEGSDDEADSGSGRGGKGKRKGKK
ncbi:Molecular chaperone (DnaJ superfamily) [Phaffia rhodozyma]|uniref:Molecular chaperone (DnaJ superfamily) n=1 Tax=Phaffia rhodozyma TaxID=264483 RepID=A0A0F7SKC7_PHARH|nr:Molecular chaperone (DnaJ superfamily) [Phaffia rhodozyma]